MNTHPRPVKTRRFSLLFAGLSLFLLVLELYIGLYVHDQIIRPFAGDFLVVILLYSFIQSFRRFPPLYTAPGVLLFSFLVEGLQYLHLVQRLGLDKYPLARLLIGTTFQGMDLLMYTGGILLVLGVEYLCSRKTDTHKGGL